MLTVAQARTSQLTDGLEAVFDIPAGGQPVLEIVGGNTPWLDLVFGRFFAAMGGRLDRYLLAGNDAAAGDRITRWRSREGIDLTVEIAQGDGWRAVATVPTVGPAALREIAIPLSGVAAGRGAVTVRLRGGLGFWRVDRLALSTRLDSPIELHRVRPATARGTGGRDEGDMVAAVDGRYNVLTMMDERLDLTFEVPPVPGIEYAACFCTPTGITTSIRLCSRRGRPARSRPFATSRAHSLASAAISRGSTCASPPAPASSPLEADDAVSVADGLGTAEGDGEGGDLGLESVGWRCGAIGVRFAQPPRFAGCSPSARAIKPGRRSSTHTRADGTSGTSTHPDGPRWRSIASSNAS